jgi:hypothetical protein
MRVTKRRIHDSRVRHTEDELLEADAGQELLFGTQSIVGDGVELKDGLQIAVGPGNRREDAFVRRDML